jgi:hypothetical protein
MEITQFCETLVDTILGLDNQGSQTFNKQELTTKTCTKKQQKNVVKTDKSETNVLTAIKVKYQYPNRHRKR